jgi:hypothetical protein
MSQPQQPDPLPSVWPPGLTRDQARNWLRQVLHEAFAHHYSLTGAMQRESAAKGLGLDATQYRTPYPGPTVVQVYGQPPQQQQQAQQPPPAPRPAKAGILPTLVTAAGVLFGGAGAGVLASHFLKQPAPPPASVKPIELDVKWQGGKGTVEPVKE